MNYQRIYNSIISNSKKLEKIRIQQKKQKLNYFERHHIIPKCMKGDNSKENLVYLTAKEHFICHRLLVEIYPGNKSILFAFWKMVLGGDTKQERYIVSSSTYEFARKLHSKNMSDSQKGKSVIERFGANASRIKLFNSSDINPMIGTNLKTIWINKYGESIANELYDTWKRNCSSSKIGKKSRRETCKYCGLETIVTNIVRFHNNNCKHKKDNLY